MTDRPKMTCHHADTEGEVYCCMACYENHLKRAKINAFNSIINMLNKSAGKAKILADTFLYNHAATLVRNYRNANYPPN